MQLHGCRRGLVRGAGAAAPLSTLRDSAGSVFGRVDGIEIYFKHPMKDSLKISRVDGTAEGKMTVLWGAGIKFQPPVPQLSWSSSHSLMYLQYK